MKIQNNSHLNSLPLQGKEATNKTTIRAFTLVELIVVITILAILGMIAFISLQGYSADARDSSRISDINHIKTSLELQSLASGKYPMPDNSQQVTLSGGTVVVWYQGAVGETVTKILSRNLSEKPTDPLYNTEYIYSVTPTQNQYEVMSVYEGDMVYNNILQNSPLLAGEGLGVGSANASSNTVRIDGTYNGVYVKSDDNIIPTPSIITSLNPAGLELNETTITSQVINRGTNVPNIGTTKITQSTGALTFSTFEVYNGELNEESSTGAFLSAYQAIANTYNGSSLASEGVIKTLLTQTTDEQKIEFTKSLILSTPIGGSSGTDTGTTPTYSCTGTLPTQNVTTSNNTGLSADTPRQNTASGNSCYYECTLGYTGDNCDVEPVLITSTNCTNAGWIWVDDTTDTIGNGFCISPRVTGGTEFISWMDIGTAYGWTRTNASPMTAANAYADNAYGVTYDLGSYTCKALGTSVLGLTLSDGDNNVLSDNIDSTLSSDDTIENRMRYLAKYKTDSTKIDDANIDWITVPSIPAGFSVPALYLSDCIDGTRDLTTGKTYDGVDYATYSNTTTNTDASRTLRNRYLLGWTKQTGSHLPSAYSDISSEIADMLTVNKGEYQIACEAGKFGTVSGTAGNLTGSEDDTANKRIRLSAVGTPTGGIGWGSYARLVGNYGCGAQDNNNAGGRYATRSARFVVRP